MSFNPNDVGVANGNIFGFPVLENEANIHIIPVPWDVSASYRKGTSNAPEKILIDSSQLDFYHHQLDRAYLTKVFMSPISNEWKRINDELSLSSIEYIDFLENGGNVTENPHFQEFLNEVNVASSELKNNLKEKATSLLNQGKIVAVLGGEHSTPLGLIEALNDKNESFGILQIDAHADLRCEYEGFIHSHASIMYNVINSCNNVNKLVQVGVRDICENEVSFIKQNSKRIKTFFDWDIKEELYKGKNWDYITQKIIHSLPKNIYISFDIDGLKQYLCPNTGTPVAGGLELEEVNYLLFELVNAGKKIIGFDLNEVGFSNNTNNIDANVGARALWNLVCATEKSRRNN